MMHTVLQSAVLDAIAALEDEAQVLIQVVNITGNRVTLKVSIEARGEPICEVSVDNPVLAVGDTLRISNIIQISLT